jgi:hypothetical protein
MELLGGLLVGGELRKDCAFRPVTGALEMAMAEVRQSEVSWPARVTRVLCAALERLGGEAPTWERVHGLSVGDRQHLVRQLAAHVDRDALWFTEMCAGCGEPFDFFVQQSTMPVKPAGSGYPFAVADTALGRVRVRVPTGVDQAAVAVLPVHEDVERALMLRLVIVPEGVDASAASDDDVNAIEAAVEAIAPEVATRTRLACPGCGVINELGIDPYQCLARGADELFAEIHLLASHYHWSEAEILAMPRARRRIYIRLVDASRGMSQ